ncbi:cyclin B1 interacting protein 1, E3 ubiquitin protein ligase [Entomortierella beljakovae]|nr:cyclin B1 interacting protein 1, E3 ubiquitin protein ligase [Entomortierella beljakovae]
MADLELKYRHVSQPAHSILSGLKPEIIMEICARAISFWTYQASQEIRYQEMSSKACGEKLNAQERQTQIITREFGIEFEALQKEIENEKHKANELAERLEDKSRQLSRLQTLYERERRRPLFSNEILQVHQTQDSYGSVDKTQAINMIVMGRNCKTNPQTRERIDIMGMSKDCALWV